MEHKCRSAVVAILLMTIIYPMNSHADGDFADNVVSGLRSFDSNVSAIQEKGFTGWLTDHMTDKAWEHIPDLFGALSDTAHDAQTAGTHFYNIGSQATNTFVASAAGAAPSADAATMQEAQQSQSKFWDWLPDEQRDLEKDGLQMSMPKPLKELADKVETFYNNTNWVADKIAPIPSAIEDSVASITSHVQGYVADIQDLGLEPGSDNYQAAAAATINGAPAFASNAESAMKNDSVPSNPSDEPSTAADESPAPRQAEAKSTSKVPANDLVADLQSAGWDSGSATNNSSAINSDDLAALGGGSGSTESASKIDTAQLQSDLSDWDRQQEEARQQEKARLAAIEQQRQAEADARQLQAARDYAARQQAAQEAELASQRQAQEESTSNGMSLFDAVTMGIQSWQSLAAAKRGQSTTPGNGLLPDPNKKGSCAYIKAACDPGLQNR
jgi:hypothetical protein